VSGLLADYGAEPTKAAGAALERLNSTSPEARRAAAVWFAENAPADAKQQARVAGALAGMLDDLSPEVDALALRALKLWATEDSLPRLVAFARRAEKARICRAELIDVLSRFPEESAADAIALQLSTPADRGRAAEALVKLGRVATKTVLRYVDDPDPDVRNEARELCGRLNVPAAKLLEQTLADVADAQKARACVALQALARMRPDDASRDRVARALNAPLLDADPAIHADAMKSVRVWGSQENTATLLKLLAMPRKGGRDCEVIDLLGCLQDPDAAPALAEGLTRPEERRDVVEALIHLGSGAEEAVAPYLQSSIRVARYAACYVLGEVGTSKSLPALADAPKHQLADYDFSQQTRIAAEKITARQG
jgi:hypothetical protein